MAFTISHSLSMTSPNDAAYENQPQHWNSRHFISFDNFGTISSYEPFPLVYTNQTAIPNGASISHAGAFQLPQAGSFSFIRVPVTFTTNSTAFLNTAGALNGSAGIFSTWNAVVYSLGTGANSQSLQSVASGSGGWTLSNSISVAANGSNMSISQTISGIANGNITSLTTQYSSTDAVSYPIVTSLIHTVFSGNRYLDIPFANSLSAGAYWLIYGYSSSSASNSTGVGPATNCNVSFSNAYVASQATMAFREMNATQVASAHLGAGSFSTAGGGTTNSLNITNLSSVASNIRPYFQMLRSA